MRRTMLLAAVVIGTGVARGQSMVEYGAMAGAAGTASKGASRVGASLEKSLKSVNGSLGAKPAEAAGGKAAAPGAGRVERRPATPVPPKPSREILAAVQVGWERAELIAKAGKPAFAIVSADEEVLSYACKEGAAYRVVVKEGKVSEVREK